MASQSQWQGLPVGLVHLRSVSLLMSEGGEEGDLAYVREVEGREGRQGQPEGAESQGAGVAK